MLHVLTATPTLIVKPSLSMRFGQHAGRNVRQYNCYAYALNEPRLGWPRPGFLNRIYDVPGQPFRDPEPWSPELMRRRLIEDGLEPVSPPHRNPASEHLIAAWMGQVYDDGIQETLHTFHFARRDGTGFWSHKDSDGDPRAHVMGVIPILAPQMIVHPDYNHFVGYFRVPAGGIACRARYRL